MEEITNRSILVITERFYPENFLVNDLAESWVRAGARVRVLTQAPSYPQDRLYPGYANRLSRSVERGIEVLRFKTVLGYKRSLARKILNYLAFMLRAIWYGCFEIPKVDAVFVYHTGPLTQALPLVVAKILFRKKTSIWTQDVWPDTVFAYGFPSQGAFAQLLKAFVRFIYRFTDVVLVSSPGFCDRLKPYVPAACRVAFVPQWTPSEFERGEAHSLTLKKDGVSFIFTGNVGSMQNLERVILAFGALEPGTATLHIVGDGSYKERLMQTVRDRGIRNVNFYGSVPQSQVKSLISACDFSLLSLVENPLISLTIPAKFQAYLSAGRPILAVAGGELKSLVEAHRLGITADPAVHESIVAALRKAVCSDALQREAWSAAGKALHNSMFNRSYTIKTMADYVFI